MSQDLNAGMTRLWRLSQALTRLGIEPGTVIPANAWKRIEVLLRGDTRTARADFRAAAHDIGMIEPVPYGRGKSPKWYIVHEFPTDLLGEATLEAAPEVD